MLGFIISDEDADTLYMRGLEEACHHSLVLKKATEAPRCERIGIRVYTEDDLEKTKAHFEHVGLPVKWVDVAHQGKTLHVSDAVGTPLEICATMTTKPRMIVKFQHFKGAYPMRLDHFQILSPDVQRACEFYAGIGFRLSEYVAIDGTDDLVFIFLQRKGNTHDLVFVNGRGPRLHHFAFSVPDSHQLIHACDVASSFGYGVKLEAGPGRHGPGHALFIYFRDPDGHRLEFFTTHYQMMDIEIEPIRWDVSYLRNRPWGLPPPKSWYEEASLFAGIEPRNPARAIYTATLEGLLPEQSKRNRL
jgi:catechol 2,3-dioxygenase